MPTKEELASWKEWAWARVTVSGRVCNTPCFLAHVCFTADSAGNATAAVYDGHGELEEVVIDIAALQHDETDERFDPPLYLRRGLYVKLGSNVTSLFVHFLPLREGH